MELASLGRAGAGLPGSGSSLVRPSPRAGRAPATASQPLGSRQRRPRRPGSLWAAGGEWQAPASPSHTPVSVSPPPAAAVAGHLCAAELSRAEPSRAALPAGRRAAGEAAGGSPLPAGPPPACGDIGRGVPRVAPGAGAPVPSASRTSPSRRRRGAGRRAGSAPAAQARSPSFPLAVRRAAGGSGL